MKRTKRYDLYGMEIFEIIEYLECDKDFDRDYHDAIIELRRRIGGISKGYLNQKLNELAESVLDVFLAWNYGKNKEERKLYIAPTFESQFARSAFYNARRRLQQTLREYFGIEDEYLKYKFTYMFEDERVQNLIKDRDRHQRWCKFNKKYLLETYKIDIDNKEEYEYRS